MTYTQRQIEAVRDLARLHNVQIDLDDSQCAEYLDWYLRTQTAEARGIGSFAEAKQDGFLNGAAARSQQKMMLLFVGSRD